MIFCHTISNFDRKMEAFHVTAWSSLGERWVVHECLLTSGWSTSSLISLCRDFLYVENFVMLDNRTGPVRSAVFSDLDLFHGCAYHQELAHVQGT